MKLKMASILPTGQWYAPSAVIAWYCIVLHGIEWYCMVLHSIAWYCMDIAVVAQKVKVVIEDWCDLKKWVLFRL